MNKLIGLVVIATAAVAGLATAGDAKKDLDLLQGNWKVVSIKESDPVKTPTEEFVKEMAVTVKGDVMKFTARGETTVTMKIRLDATKTPRTIDCVLQDGPNKGKSEPGIYKIEGAGKGATLTMCANDAGKDRPSMFATKEGTNISLIVLRKAK